MKISVSLTHIFGVCESGRIYNWSTTTLKVHKVTGLEERKNQAIKQIVSGNNFTNILLDNGEIFAANFTQDFEGDMELK